MRATFAIPGDKDQRTGGYIYDATVLRLLNEIGTETAYLELPDSFPDPSPEDLTAALDALAAVPEAQAVIIDGLAFGAMDAGRIAHLRAPIIALVHHPLGLETGLHPDRATALIRNEAQVLAHATHVIVTSAHVARTLTADFGVDAKRITLATPGVDRVVDKVRADAIPVSPVSPVTPALILSVGLLTRRKGHDVLIGALARINDLPWQAEIVGRWQDPDYTAALQTQIAQTGLGDRVTLRGELEADTLQDAYRRASLFALATRYEGYGMVLGEAMMHGLPIVSCDAGAVAGTVGDAARLVPPNNPDAFADALRHMLQTPESLAQAASASRAKAASLPTWHDTARIVAGVIDRTTQTHSSLERSIS